MQFSDFTISIRLHAYPPSSRSIMSRSVKSAKEMDSLSRKLSKALRHDALRMGLRMSSDGSVAVDELLSHDMFKQYTVQDIRDVVSTSEKKRFELSDRGGILRIRAAQGHTISEVLDSELLREVKNASEIPVCVHGTYKECLQQILEGGLKRMKRNHIHFAMGMPNTGEVMSGMRKSCDIAIYVDVASAMADGVKFYKSSNDVILTAGIGGSGVLPVKYFQRIEKIK